MFDLNQFARALTFTSKKRITAVGFCFNCSALFSQCPRDNTYTIKLKEKKRTAEKGENLSSSSV